MVVSFRILVAFALVLFALSSPLNCTSLLPLVRAIEGSNEHGHGISPERDGHHDPGHESFRGWTPQPSGRGTIDIIWSCVFTIFLCCWSVLCLNVPAEKDGFWKIIWRKFSLTCLGILGPEFILQSALGQWISAKRSYRQFHASGFPGWTMAHAYFADMGGFVLKTTDWVPFPIDAKQLHYLIVHRYLPYPTISKKEIKDRNKVDTLLRVITILQTLWFVLNCIARTAQHLAITTFELTTMGFIYCTLGTYLCWGHKPADVEVPIVLHSDTSIRQILLEAGSSETASRPYSRTPLDFVSRKEWSWSLWWSFIMNICNKMMHVRFQPKIRPITRIPNDIWPEIPSAGVFIIGCVDMVYAAIYMCGWNFWFATPVERTLWRVSTTTIISIVVAYLVIESYTFTLRPALLTQFRRLVRPGTSSPTRTWSHNPNPAQENRALKWLRNNSRNKDPLLYMPLKASIPITLAGAVYVLARAYLLLECILALRKLPSSAYESVNWSNFLPHV